MVVGFSLLGGALFTFKYYGVLSIAVALGLHIMTLILVEIFGPLVVRDND